MVLKATPTEDGQVEVLIGVDVTITTTVVMPAWAYHALGTEGVAQAAADSYRRTVRRIGRR